MKSGEASQRIESLSSTISQLEEKVAASQEKCEEMKNQLQKKEVSIAGLTGKLELISSELQSKVSKYSSTIEPFKIIIVQVLNVFHISSFSQESAVSRLEREAAQQEAELKEQLSAEKAKLTNAEQRRQQLQEDFDQVHICTQIPFTLHFSFFFPLVLSSTLVQIISY